MTKQYWICVTVELVSGKFTCLSILGDTFDEVISNTWEKSGKPNYPLYGHVISRVVWPQPGDWNGILAKELLIA